MASEEEQQQEEEEEGAQPELLPTVQPSPAVLPLPLPKAQESQAVHLEPAPSTAAHPHLAHHQRSAPAATHHSHGMSKVRHARRAGMGQPAQLLKRRQQKQAAGRRSGGPFTLFHLQANC